MSIAKYSVGNRVYKGASSAPTRGTVDPMGYVERSLNNPSQSRSGLAQAALRRMKPGGAVTGLAQATSQVDARNKPQGAPGQQATGGSAAPTPGMGGPPSLAVTDIGKLRPQLPGASQGGTSLPFDPEAADAQQNLQGQKNRFESDATAEGQRIEREYGSQRRDIEDQQPEDARRLLEGYAGRGLAYSSGYSYDQADQQGQYSNLMSELEQGRTGGLADLLRQRGLFNDDYAGRLQSIQTAAARRLADQAGDLNLGGGGGGGGIEDILKDLFPDGQGAPRDGRDIDPGFYTQPAPTQISLGGGYRGPEPTAAAPAPAPAPVAVQGVEFGGGGWQPPTTPVQSGDNQTTLPQIQQAVAASRAPAPAAPRPDANGNITIGGARYHVNSRGIIDTRGPNYGRYPAEVR